MPLATIAINRFNRIDPTAYNLKITPLSDIELKLCIENLYDNSLEFASGSEAIDFFETAFKRYNWLYLGILQGRVIAAIGCFDEGQTDSKRLQYLVVSHNNQGQGIAAKFIKQVTDLECLKGVKHFMAGNDVIHRILVRYDL
mgnify:CR=1 FL=1